MLARRPRADTFADGTASFHRRSRATEPVRRGIAVLRLGQREVFKTLAIAVLAASLIGTGACSRPQPSPNKASPTPVAQGPIAYPDFPILFYQGQEALGGRESRFSSLLSSGRPIVVNYWASNCPPCSAEMPEFDRVYRAYQGRVLFLGLDVGRFYPGFGNEEDSKQELRRLKISYPAGTPLDIRTVAALGVKALPSTEFIKPNGERFRSWAGILNEKKLTELIEELLQRSAARP